MITPITTLESPFLAVPSFDISDFNNDDDKLNEFIHEHCVKQGTPLVFTNLQSLPGWDKDLFDLKRTAQLYGDKGIYIEKPEAPLDKKTIPLVDYVALIQYSLSPSEELSATTDSPKVSSPSLEPTSPIKDPSPTLHSQPLPETSSPTDDLSTPHDYSEKLPADSKEVIINATDDSYPFTTLCTTHVSQQPSQFVSRMDEKDTSTNDFVMNYLEGVQISISERIHTGARRRKCREESQQQQAQQARPKPKRSRHNHQQKTTKETIDRSLYYAKDIDCLDEYKERLPQIIPPSLLPLGDTDLIRTLPPSLQAVNLLCYLGGNRTGTALHRDISGAVGHNMMTFGDESAYAQWLIIKKDESQKLRELCQEEKDNSDHIQKERHQKKESYFLECEQACVSPEQLAQHGITTHVIFQRPGDLIIIPSLCYHQVSNVGVSFKMAWNRITPHSLLEGIKIQLPLYRIIGRSELYRCKATVYFALKDILNNMPTKSTLSSCTQQQSFLEKCRILLHLFANDVILPEIIEPIPIENVNNKNIIREDDATTGDCHGFNVVCDFCQGDVFCRYYHCENCELDLCLDCYGMGRSCPHISDLCMHESILPNAATNSDKDMAGYIGFYEKIVDRLNLTFGLHSIVPDITSFYHRGDNYSLATACRRIEMYRKKHKYLSNKFYCSHCQTIFDMKDLHRDPKSIFERRSCFKALNSSPNSTLFVCDDCSQRCLSCHPTNIHQRTKTDLVYFRDMGASDMLWGGFEDRGLFETTSWPDYKMKIKPGDKTSLEKLGNKTWHYPEDFLTLAAATLINQITPEGWKCWGSGDDSLSTLIQQISQEWAHRYSKRLKSGTIPSGTTFEINTLKKKKQHAFINATGLSLEIPSMDQIIKKH